MPQNFIINPLWEQEKNAVFAMKIALLFFCIKKEEPLPILVLLFLLIIYTTTSQ